MTTATLDPITIQNVETKSEDGKYAHIVYLPENEKLTVHAYILEARINGFEVEALCGYRWIPQRDPKSLPLCSKCLEIYQGVLTGEDLPDA